MNRPPWVATMLATLRATGSLVEARKAAGVNAAEVSSACEADATLQAELEAARQEGLAAKRKGDAGGVRDFARRAMGAATAGVSGAGRGRPGRGLAQGDTGADRSGTASGRGVAPPHETSERTSMDTGPSRGASGAVDAEGWRRAAEVSAVRELIQITRSEIGDDAQRVYVEAEAAFGPGLPGTLKWIDSRCAMVRGWHPLDPWWLASFDAFYASGKTIMTCRKGLRAGGSSSACRALGNDAIFTMRELDPGTIGVVPIISSSRDEATGRFVTLRQLFRAIGLAPEKGDEEEGAIGIPGGLGGTYRSTRSQSGGGIIKLEDSQGHRLEFAIMPAMKRSGVGYTGVAGFIDESDLWPNDPDTHVNPAGDVIDFVLERLTTQRGAHLYLFSASYNAESAHKERVDDGDTPIQHLARLGHEGVRVDVAARAELASYLRSVGARVDPKLLVNGPIKCPTCEGEGRRKNREGEPIVCGVCRGAKMLAPELSPDVPAWVTNGALAPISRCYSFSKQSVPRMLARYGGRAAENKAANDESPLADVDITIHERFDACVDVVFGVAPPRGDSAAWGIVAVGYVGQSLVVLGDFGGQGAGLAAAETMRAATDHHRPSVLAVASDQERLVAGEMAAAYAGRGIAVAPLAPQNIYDGGVLRVGPLRSLYHREFLRHAPGLDALEATVRAWHPEAPRSPRVEALVAAVTRLLACYPWLGGAPQEPDPVRGPRYDDEHIGLGEGRLSAVRRLGGRVDSGDTG